MRITNAERRGCRTSDLRITLSAEKGKTSDASWTFLASEQAREDEVTARKTGRKSGGSWKTVGGAKKTRRETGLQLRPPGPGRVLFFRYFKIIFDVVNLKCRRRFFPWISHTHIYKKGESTVE